MHKVPSSVIVFEGPSRFDGAPIVAVVTGLRRQSKNPKTGRMAQMWILRADMSPLEAIDRRLDYSVCCDCPLRPGSLPTIDYVAIPRVRRRVATEKSAKQGVCYVAVKNAPLQVWRKYAAGGYTRMDPSELGEYLGAQNLPIRFGAYGEPTALPVYVLREIAAHTDVTGTPINGTTARIPSSIVIS